jgi:hypothetical protein
MYLDVKGLVTTGIGNLVDPAPLAMSLPFLFKVTNQPATKEQIAVEWRTIKQHTELAKEGHLAAGKIAELYLDSAGIDALVLSRLDSNEAIILKEESFKDFEIWPADAQLGVLSMAWAMGPEGFKRYPIFSSACARRAWKTAAAECKMHEEGNPGLVPRDEANSLLFSNAAVVQAPSLYAAQLYWPRVLV